MWAEIGALLWLGAHFALIITWCLFAGAWIVLALAWYARRTYRRLGAAVAVRLREVEMAAWMMPGGIPPRRSQNEKSPRRRLRFRAAHVCPPQPVITITDLDGRPLLGPISGEQLAYLARYGAVSSTGMLLADVVMTIEPVADSEVWKAPA